MKAKKRGGKRENSGRKPTSNPKIPVTIYIEKLKIEQDGGKLAVRDKILSLYESSREK